MMKILLVLLSLSVAHADQDGNLQKSPYNCESNVYSSLDKVCQLFKNALGISVCNKTANTCVNASQEMFNGLNVELATPTNIKSWTGYGGLGELYQDANLCILRDLKDGAITAQAKASTFLGEVSVTQDIGFLSSTPGKTVSGFHHTKVCAPVVGCIDAFTQKFSLTALKTDMKNSGQKVGDYQIYSSHSLQYDAEGFAQGIKVNLPSITVPTPYGSFAASPEFSLGKAVGFNLAPYGGNVKSKFAPLNAHLTETYGRNPGYKISQLAPYHIVTDNGSIDNSHLGWNSQVALGSRDANPKKAIWTAPAGEEWPVRPDTDLSMARSKEEKFPNAYLGANVKVSYSPTDMLPDWIKDSGFLSLSFDIFVKPMIDVGFTSQLNLANTEIAEIKAPYLDYRPMNMDQYKGFSIYSGVSAAARTALDAGVDLKVHLHVPLPWPLEDINEDLINISPTTTVAEKIDAGYGTGNKSALAYSQGSKVLATKNFFQIYNTLNGPQDGAKHIQTCLAKPTEAGALPPEPTYTPGNPVDITKDMLYPCNICVGMNDKTWKDQNGQTQTIKGFINSYFPSDFNTRPDADKWICNDVAKTGCYDMCKYDSNTKKLSVTETALEMLAKGEAKKMPIRCK